jgi:hypothetical protein
MALTKEQQDALLLAFRQSWSGRQCPICQTDSWEVSDSIFGLPEFSHGLLSGRGGAFYPVVPVNCNNCGYVIFFSAIKLGLFGEPSQ